MNGSAATVFATSVALFRHVMSANTYDSQRAAHKHDTVSVSASMQAVTHVQAHYTYGAGLPDVARRNGPDALLSLYPQALTLSRFPSHLKDLT